MKKFKYTYITFLAMLFVLTIVSCEEEDGVGLEEASGEPVVTYVRVINPISSDSLLVRANLGSEIALIGENLGGTRQIWFNDQPAELNPIWVTNRSIIVAVPAEAPNVVTNTLYLVNDNSDTLKYPFEVSIGAPLIESAQNEWPKDGGNLVINGNFFFEPITLTYTGDVVGELVSVTQDRVEFTVPEGALEGPVTVTTNFGETESGFHLRDSRNIFLNFDDLSPNGWRVGAPETGSDALDGNYNVFRADLEPNERNEGPSGNSTRLFHYWGGADPNRSESLLPDYPGAYRDHVLKFEARVVDWLGGYLNICLAPVDHIDSNQEIWSNDINARAIWGPWSDSGEEYSTNGEWVTVVIPLTDFQYTIEGGDGEDITYAAGQDFIESATGSLSMWLIGSPENTGNAVEFHIDNLRIVEP